MFFEGPEKKVELALVSGKPSLRSRGHDYWKEIVAKANAQVLSTISNESMDAYLLSESSLFVTDTWLTMITCGRTDLVSAVMKLVDDFGVDSFQYLVYERKNAHHQEYQPSNFFDDCRRLSDRMPAKLPTRLEAGTPNTVGYAGLLAALEWTEREPGHAALEHERGLGPHRVGEVERLRFLALEQEEYLDLIRARDGLDAAEANDARGDGERARGDLDKVVHGFSWFKRALAGAAKGFVRLTVRGAPLTELGRNPSCGQPPEEPLMPSSAGGTSTRDLKIAPLDLALASLTP